MPTEAHSPSRTREVRVLLACAAGSTVNLATTLLYSFGVFVKPITASTGWPESAIAGTVGPAFLLTMATLPIAGLAVARVPPRSLACIALLLLAAGTFAVGALPQSPRQFAVLLAFAVVIGSCAAPNLYAAIISRVFDHRRGLALGFVQAFTGLGIAVLPPFAVFIISRFGWRSGYMALGIVAAIMAFVVAALLPSIPKLAPANVDKAGGNAATGLTIGEALYTRVFWTIAALYLLLSTVANGLPVQLPVLLAERGFTPQMAAFGMSVMGMMVIVGRIVIGYLLDRVTPAQVMSIMLAGPFLGCAFLLSSKTHASGLLAAAGLGIAVGGEFVGLAWMVSRAFGLRSFGVIFGWLSITIGAGTSFGPMLVTYLRATTGSFNAPVTVMLGVAAFSIAIALTLRISQFPYQSAARAQRSPTGSSSVLPIVPD